VGQIGRSTEGKHKEGEEIAMSVYKPKRKGTESKYYVCEFVYQGKRFQESTGATSKTVAKEFEKRRKAELERAHAGIPTYKAQRIRTVAEIVASYLAGYRLNHRPKSISSAEGVLANVDRILGKTLLSDLTEERGRDYIRRRQNEGMSGRTINMELGELSRAIGRTWKELWPKVRKLEERKDIGQALSPEQQHSLLDAVEAGQSPILKTLVPLLLLTGMRKDEAFTLQWRQIDLLNTHLTVGRAKTSSGTGRVIPINEELLPILKSHRQWFVENFGNPRPDHYLFPWGSPIPKDPSRHVVEVKTAWTKARRQANVSCRLHDLRHTYATQLAENGVPESTMLALMGHMSRAMLERYSHIRMKAKRDAVAKISLRPKIDNSGLVPVKVPVSTENELIQ
jgi:integrase